MIAVENKILDLVSQHKSAKPVGITSVCSANYFVIKSAMINAKKYNQNLLIETTSNQVDQFGGYTGITPSQFSGTVYNMAGDINFPEENIILGGDHLGPNRWQDEVSNVSMQKAQDQITAYISAGYTKIHLDASMKCADDGDKKNPLDSHIIAERSALLCKASEDAFRKTSKGNEAPVYVIGSDVPPPGGAKDKHNDIKITASSDVEETIELTKKAFEKYDLHDAWKRVVAVVVQPGVEFGDNTVIDYNRESAINLIKLIEQKDNLVYEAHSTDYQKKENLKQMVEDHFAILKVGPWLTFAFREAIFALSIIEKELLAKRKGIILSDLIGVIEERMINNPVYWENYYGKDDDEKRIGRKYSYSDRIRYYWSDNKVNDAVNILLKNLSENRVPPTLISQFLPDEFFAIREGTISAEPEELIIHKISKVLEIYNFATNGGVN